MAKLNFHKNLLNNLDGLTDIAWSYCINTLIKHFLESDHFVTRSLMNCLLDDQKVVHKASGNVFYYFLELENL